MAQTKQIKQVILSKTLVQELLNSAQEYINIGWDHDNESERLQNAINLIEKELDKPGNQ